MARTAAAGVGLALALSTAWSAAAIGEPLRSAFVADNLNLRAGPGSRHPVVAVIPRSSPVLVHGCEPTLKWCDVTAGDRRGWAFSRFILYPVDARNGTDQAKRAAPAVGAVGGAVAGAVIGGPVGALIGGAIGTIAGAVAGPGAEPGQLPQ